MEEKKFDKNSITSGSSISLADAGASISIGNDDLFGIKLELNGSILNSEARNNIGLEGMKYSVGFDRSATASVFKEEASVSVSALGFSVKGTFSACELCGGGGAKMNLGYDEKNNDFYLNLGGKLGVGILGVKLDLDFKIDL